MNDSKVTLLASLLDKHRHLKNDIFNFNNLRHLYRDSDFRILKKTTAHFRNQKSVKAKDVVIYITNANAEAQARKNAEPSAFEIAYDEAMKSHNLKKQVLKNLDVGAAYIWAHPDTIFPESKLARYLTDDEVKHQIFALRAKYPHVFLKIKAGSELEAFGIAKGYISAK